MWLPLLMLLVVLLDLASAVSVPRRLKNCTPSRRCPQPFMKRNATAGSDTLSLDIDPDLVNPVCGGIYEANINVQSAPDPFYLTPVCNNILSYIGGPKGDKDVDIIFTCAGFNNSGTGIRDVKIVFSTEDDSPIDAGKSGTQLIPANMELVAEKQNVFFSSAVSLGVKMKGGTSDIVFQYIYC
ncbi:uncharacterized protein A1O5_08489 [Cladophialophora psammophila CBS 110553]|uniref:Uncharacterized protein n=1 Tax=Cladophialophora psammophila CBS 110553 TaxID=1182543 RepID=W9WUH2_9EURO|nr:uncharacterized protein A1O5_08489 [Cladophialophora psammophila CBS 110553]EXJ68695.1 hypothetical protein A1O5_08489 [Cladophialophora psammophila CBS 110553]